MKAIVFFLAFFLAGLVSEAADSGEGLLMKVTSPDFKENGFLPISSGYKHGNKNPALIVERMPPSAKSLVLIIDDPDAPSGEWTHCVAYNMPPRPRIDSGEIPGMLGMNDFGSLSYGGPCPPSGTHRYRFKIYALDIVLPLGEGADKKTVIAGMEGHVVASAVLTGLYKSR